MTRTIINQSDDIRDAVDGFTPIRVCRGSWYRWVSLQGSRTVSLHLVEVQDNRYGNWTERRVYEFNPENHKPKRAFSAIDYQVIEYYDDSKPTK